MNEIFGKPRTVPFLKLYGMSLCVKKDHINWGFSCNMLLYIFIIKNLRCLWLKTLTFEGQLNKLSESVTVSKSELKVFAILLFLVKNSPFSLNAIFEFPKECWFEKYGLELFQNGFESFQGLTNQNDPFYTDCLVLLQYLTIASAFSMKLKYHKLYFERY